MNQIQKGKQKARYNLQISIQEKGSVLILDAV